MHVYRFRLANGSGSYHTDATTLEEAQAELSLHFMRPVTVWTPAEHDLLQSAREVGTAAGAG